jgi:iron complex outermembrane receptor protein
LKANTGSVIEISTIGYRTHHVVLGNETELNISLSENIVSLDDVSAVGYGTLLRKDITGAVSRITAKEFNTGIITIRCNRCRVKWPA